MGVQAWGILESLGQKGNKRGRQRSYTRHPGGEVGISTPRPGDRLGGRNGQRHSPFLKAEGSIKRRLWDIVSPQMQAWGQGEAKRQAGGKLK